MNNDDINKNNMQIHIDYFSFTFPLKIDEGSDILHAFESFKSELSSLLFMDDYGEVNNYAQNNYDYQLSLGEYVTIRFGGRLTSMKEIVSLEDGIKSVEKFESCNIELKGQGCREVETKSDGKMDYVKLIDFCFRNGGKITRLDIALDDTKGDIITINEVVKNVAKGLYTSSFRSLPVINASIGKDVSDDDGMSLYFGKSNGKHKNDLELCIYNKKAERAFNNDSWSGDYWTRYELRFRGDKALELAYFMSQNNMQDLGDFATGQLRKVLQLKADHIINGKKSNDSNIRRYDINPKWEMLLQGFQGVNFCLLPRMEVTILRKKEWRSYSLTRQNILMELANAYSNRGDEWDDVAYAELCDKLQSQLDWFNSNKVTQRDLALINNYIVDKNSIKSIYDDETGEYVEASQLISMEDVENYRKELKERLDFFKSKMLPF